MKLFKKSFAIILCLVVLITALPTVVFAADKITVAPNYPFNANLEISKDGINNTYGSTYNDFSNQFCLDFTKKPVDLTLSEQLEFDIYIDNYTDFNKAFGGKIFCFNISSSSTNKMQERTNYSIIDQITKTGWNHIKLLIRSNSTDISNVTYIYLSSSGGSDTNPLAAKKLRIANICGVTGILYLSIPSLTVGKDESEMYVTWADSVSDKGKVVLEKGGYESTFYAFETKNSVLENRYFNRVKITGLEPNSTYKYRVGNDKYLSKEYTFKTNDFDDDFSFVQVTDVQYNGSSSVLNNWNKTLSNIKTYFPETTLIVNTGDVADSCSNERYAYYKSPELFKSFVFGVVPGNHDNNPKYVYNEIFTSPDTYQLKDGFGENESDYWYSYNNILFISLNTNIKDNTYHEKFIRKVVKEQGDKFDWKIVTCHHSLFSAGYHRRESDVISFREKLAPLFTELKIDMILSGHDHCYDRSYIMTGTTPNPSNEGFAAKTNGGVLYISAQSSSGIKFNDAESGIESYSAKVIEDQCGFIHYDVREGVIELTYYRTEDMKVLDTFTLYKDSDAHTVTSDADIIDNKFINDVKFNSNGEYNYSFDNTKDISNTCSVELDVLLTENNLDSIEVALMDSNNNSIKKSFEGLENGWNHLVFNLDEATVNGNIDYKNITKLQLNGKSYTNISISNLYIGHIYDYLCDKTCNFCDNERTTSHSYTKIVRKATLDIAGRVDYTCNYCGYIASSSYDIPKISTVKLSATSYTYNGATKTPTVNVKDSAGKTLKKDTDYTVSYASGRKNAGTYKVTVTFKGNYSGSKALTFKINPIKITSKFKFTLSTTSYTYDGKVKSPSVTVKNANGTKLTKNTHYTVTYASGRKNVGTYKVTIKMKGNYSGTKTLTFKINPVKTAVSKLTAGKKSLKVYVTKKTSQVTGYQIQYSTSKSFKSYKTKTISSYKTTSTTLSGLSAKKTYYVKVRTYKTVNGTKYYSGWSSYKYTKTK